MMITASQCRSARTLLSWSVGRLASSASIRERDIQGYIAMLMDMPSLAALKGLLDEYIARPAHQTGDTGSGYAPVWDMFSPVKPTATTSGAVDSVTFGPS